MTVAALALTDDAVSLDELAAQPPERLALVVGTEGDGLSRRTLTQSDAKVSEAEDRSGGEEHRERGAQPGRGLVLEDHRHERPADRRSGAGDAGDPAGHDGAASCGSEVDRPQRQRDDREDERPRHEVGCEDDHEGGRHDGQPELTPGQVSPQAAGSAPRGPRRLTSAPKAATRRTEGSGMCASGYRRLTELIGP